MKSECNTGCLDRLRYAGIRQNADITKIKEESKMQEKRGILIGGGMLEFSKKLSERNSKK